MAYKQMTAATRKRRLYFRIIIVAVVVLALAFGAFLLVKMIAEDGKTDVFDKLLGGSADLGLDSGEPKAPDWVDVQIISVDGEARRGEALEGVNDIVIHYVGNPGTTAQQNRNYYNNPESGVSSHFVIGTEGEVIQCIPMDEKSSATNDRNTDTISIEVCHLDDSGQFTDAAYESLVKLTAWLCDEFELTEDNVIRHYDVTGKLCPLYFVENEDAWAAFKSDVGGQLG